MVLQKLSLALTACLVLLLSLLVVTTTAGSSGEPAPADYAVPGELIVLLSRNAAVPTPEEVVEASDRGFPLPAGLAEGNPIGARFVIQQRTTGRALEALLREPDSPASRLERYLVLTYPPAADVAAIAARLRRLPSVESVEPNRVYELAVAPNDPLYPNQWGLPTVNLPAAWDLTPDFGHGYVGVVDAGIDVDHEDLRENSVSGSYGTGNFRAHLSWDFGYNDSNVDEGEFQPPATQCPAPAPTAVGLAGHGTHVAGIVGATTSNGLGVAGSCGRCSLLIGKVSQLKAFPSGGVCKYINTHFTEAAIVAGIKGLVDRGAQSLSMSFGRPSGFPDCSQIGAYCDALAHASRRDVLMAAASGNGGLGVVHFPARDPRVIAVGGIVAGGGFWSSCDPLLDLAGACPSNFGPEQELVAPAREVLSTFYLGLPYGGTGCDDNVGLGGPGYGPCSGTSMSTPHVSASATLIRSINPVLSQAQIRSLLIGRASQNGVHDDQMGYGIPNVAESAQDALGRVAGAVIPSRLTPLFSLYSFVAEDFLYTDVPQMASAAYHDPQIFYNPTGPSVPWYSNFPDVFCNVGGCPPVDPGASVYVFTTPKSPRPDLPLPALVPLYRLTFRGPNPVTGNSLNRDSTYTTEPAGIQAFEAIGYKWDGIEGYIYKKCTPEPSCIPAGAVKLLRRYNPQRDDFAIFPESELASMEAAGYSSLGGSFSGYLGYVYPNVDSDFDHLIDGWEALLGTNLSEADSDCDGLLDGQEVLTFPYGDPRGTPGCQALNVHWVSQNVPTTMTAGQSYPVSLTVKNTGTLTWSPIGPQCNAFRIGSSNPRSNTTWGPSRVELPSTVDSMQQVVVPFTVTAPVNPGSYNFEWEMVQECVQWFGSPSPNVQVTVQNGPPVARFSFSCSGLSCSFDGSASTDDGSIVSYSWTFGDSTTGNGVTTGHAYTGTGAYSATLTVTDNGGLQGSVSRRVSVTGDPSLPAESYFSIAPCRLVETNDGLPLAGNQLHVFNVAGSCGIPASAKAVSVNVAVAAATSQGYVAFLPGNQTSGPFPNSTLNFIPDPVRRFNNAVLRLATDGTGTLALRSVLSGSPPEFHFSLWVDGYFSEDPTPAPGAVGPLGFQALTPCRVVDTTTGLPLTHNASQFVTVQGVCGVPPATPAAALNLTVLSPSEAGQLRVFPANVVATMGILRFPAGTIARANGARPQLAATTPDARVMFTATSGATANALLDAYGYFKSDAPLRYRPVTACRLVDTRLADHGAPAFAPGEARTVQVQGNCGVPVGAKAAVLNVTAVSPSGVGNLWLAPSGAAPPISTLSFDPTQGNLANGVFVGLSNLPNDLAVSCSGSSTHVVIDVFGYFQ